jgi:hypothetical protein
MRVSSSAALSFALVSTLAGCSGEEPAPNPAPTSTSGANSTVSDGTDPSTANTAEVAAHASGAVLFEERVIKDPARGGMGAYRLLVPEGWEVEGGVDAIGTAYDMVPYFSQVTVRSPDGRGAVFWGMLEFGYSDGVNLPIFTPFQGRPFFPLQPSLGAYWQRTVEFSPAEGVTDFVVVSETVLPEATARVREQLAALYASTREENQQLAGIGESKEFDVEARQLVVRYKEHGVHIEATVFATMRRAIYRFADGSMRAAMWNLDHMYGVFAPVEHDALQDPVLAAVVRSRTELPEWQAAIQRWYMEKNQQIIAEGNAAIAAASRQAATVRATQSQDLLDISFQGWKDRSAANDAGHSNSINGIHERTTYVNPSGTTVDLPSHYSNVYTDGQGRYVLHDDANYLINTDPAFNARDWQRIDPR